MLIAQLTDIHLGFEPDSPGEFNRVRLDAVLEELTTMDPQPDMLLATGDLVDRGDVDSYVRLRDALAPLPFPVFWLVGNHDVRVNFAEVFPEVPSEGGFYHYVVETPALRLIILDTLEEGRHGGAFCEARAEWLTARLDEATDRPTLIVQHHPPIEVGIPWMNTNPAEPWVKRLSACVEGRANVIGLVCGHIHRAITTQWCGLTVATCPSTAPQVALDLRPINPDRADDRPLIIADPPAYALHWWNGRNLITHYQTAEAHEVLASYDENLKPMIQHMLEEKARLGR